MPRHRTSSLPPCGFIQSLRINSLPSTSGPAGILLSKSVLQMTESLADLVSLDSHNVLRGASVLLSVARPSCFLFTIVSLDCLTVFLILGFVELTHFPSHWVIRLLAGCHCTCVFLQISVLHAPGARLRRFICCRFPCVLFIKSASCSPVSRCCPVLKMTVLPLSP